MPYARAVSVWGVAPSTLMSVLTPRALRVVKSGLELHRPGPSVRGHGPCRDGGRRGAGRGDDGGDLARDRGGAGPRAGLAAEPVAVGEDGGGGREVSLRWGKRCWTGVPGGDPIRGAFTAVTVVAISAAYAADASAAGRR
jgi:hypothetical protein